MIITGKTKTGFPYAIDSRIARDMRFIDLVAEIQRGGENTLAAISALIPYLFGDKKDALYEHCADEDGFVDVEKVSTEITDIFEHFTEDPRTKNS